MHVYVRKSTMWNNLQGQNMLPLNIILDFSKQPNIDALIWLGLDADMSITL